MCGVLGAVGRRPSKKDVNDALMSISTRGPDARGVLELGPCLFGHTRLSIIDTEGGQQPFQSACGRYVLTYNGEIYNYRDLMGDLAALGFEFRTSSDTEVLLAALMAWGREALNRLDGMFAFGFWDTEAETLLLARDRLGIKPLFYAETEGGMMFGSTATSVTTLMGGEGSLSPQGIADFFSFHTTLAPRSIYVDVKQLRPGHFLEYRFPYRRTESSCYWSARRAPSQDSSDFRDLVRELDCILAATVSQQLNADVPVGLFLSGGIDSSLLTHYAALQSAGPIRTYSVSFPGTSFDESSVADVVAKSYETVHTEIPLPEITADTLVNAVASLDQPLSDPAFIPLHQMSQIVSSDLKVVLSGDGSDELFGGYPRYQVDSRAFPDNWIKKSMRSGQSWGLLPGAITRRALAGREALRYRKVDVDFLPGGRKAFSSWFSEEFLSQLGDYRVMDNWSKELDRLGDDIEGLMKADWITYLSENCLQKTDRATMAFGLEGRVPFLGKAVIDFSERLSSDINFKIGLKSLPMALAEAHLPSAVWDRPKHGFTVPVSHLFRSSWRELALDMVSKLDKLAPFTNVSTCRKLIRDAVSGSAKNHALAYSLLVYLIWAEAGTIKAVSSGHKQ